MKHDETILRSGQRYANNVVTRTVGGKAIALATAATRDLVSNAMSSQMILTSDDVTVMRKTLRVADGACEAEIEFGPAMGGGALVLHWTIEADGRVAKGTGTWRDQPLAAFEIVLPAHGRDDADRFAPADATGLTMANGTKPDFGALDTEVLGAVGEFSTYIEVPEIDRSTGCVAGCTAVAAACALACAGGALTPAAPVTPLCAAGCVALESACLAACV